MTEKDKKSPKKAGVKKAEASSGKRARKEGKPAAEGRGKKAKTPAAAKKPTPKTGKVKEPSGRKPKREAPAGPSRARQREGEVSMPLSVWAKAKYVRTSARKVRLVADQIRGKSVEEARGILKLSTRSAAQDLERLLDSAVANAESNHELDPEELRVRELMVDEGPTLKRWRPRAQGRATPINKRSSHLSIALSPIETELFKSAGGGQG